MRGGVGLGSVAWKLPAATQYTFVGPRFRFVWKSPAPSTTPHTHFDVGTSRNFPLTVHWEPRRGDGASATAIANVTLPPPSSFLSFSFSLSLSLTPRFSKNLVSTRIGAKSIQIGQRLARQQFLHDVGTNVGGWSVRPRQDECFPRILVRRGTSTAGGQKTGKSEQKNGTDEISCAVARKTRCRHPIKNPLFYSFAKQYASMVVSTSAFFSATKVRLYKFS